MKTLFYSLLLHFFLAICFSSTGEAQNAEWIKVYFNMPADTTLAFPGNVANHNTDLIGTLEALIDSATTSIDLSIYDLEHPRIVHALVRAKQRGVRVRLVTDNYNRTDGGEIDKEVWARLREGEIISIDDDGDIYHTNGTIEDNSLINAGADMHHKFAVIDYKSESTEDDFVWTGSTNLTYTGAFNTNNVIVIKDTDVARVYTAEFEQMWGSQGPFPDPANSRFHKDKLKIEDQLFDVGGTKVEIHFAPIDREKKKRLVGDRIAELIRTEVQKDVRFQAFSITPGIAISEAIWDVTENENIVLEGVIDRSFYYRYKGANQIWGSNKAQTGNRLVLPANEMRKLHHKILLLDAGNEDEGDEGIVIAGSYNFSNNADRNNDENLLIIYSDSIANQFLQDFSGTLKRAKRESDPPYPVVDPNIWYNVYSVSDGSRFEIEVAPGFGFPVGLLGVNVPRIFAGPDSSEYFSVPSARYLRNLIEGTQVRVYDFDGGKPYGNRGRLTGYVEFRTDDGIWPLNKILLQKGYGVYSSALIQNEDSVIAFKKYQSEAKENRLGLWKQPERIGTKVLRAKEIDRNDGLDLVYPINVNTADLATLQLLPGIGATYANRIIEYREEHGGFNSSEELLNIKGIGEKRLEKIRPLITF